MGRVRLQVALDCSSYSLEIFILNNVEPSSKIATDSWSGYNFIEDTYHERSIHSSSKDNESLYGVHLVTSLLKRLIRGTFQGRFEPKYLQKKLHTPKLRGTWTRFLNIMQLKFHREPG